jgi:hypothetical protein
MMSSNASDQMVAQQENHELRSEVVALRNEIGLMKTKLQRQDAEIRILKKRPAPFDPITIPFLRLPAELRETVQGEALKLKKIVGAEDLLPFLRSRLDPIAETIQLPHHLRLRHVKTFVQVNTVNVILLEFLSKRIPEIMDIHGPDKMTNWIRAVHFDIGSWCMFPTDDVHAAPIRETYALLGECANLQHISVSFKIDPTLLIFHRTVAQIQGAADVEETDYSFLSSIPAGVKSAHITINNKVRTGTARLDDESEYVKAWVTSSITAIKAMILQASPQCQITEEEGESTSSLTG